MCTPVTDSTVAISACWPAWLVVVLGGEPGLRKGLGVGPVVGVVDLPVGDVDALHVERGREVDQVVARYREADRLLAAREDVNEDERVRVLAADRARVHGGDQGGRQRLPVEVGAALQPHHQDVHRLGGRRRRVAGGDPVVEAVGVADHPVRVAGHHDDHHREQAGRPVADLARYQPPETRREHRRSFLR
jgi:hypothetical protein